MGSINEHVFYVVFKDAEVRRWWQTPFVCKNFGHVVLISQMGLNVSEINPGFSMIRQNNYFQTAEPDKIYEKSDVAKQMSEDGFLLTKYLEAEQVAAAYAGSGGIVLKYKSLVDYDKSIYHVTSWIPTCVTIIKGFMGIRCWAITPLQLYKWLLKNGAEQIS
jgi:hypothetical protein